MLRKLKRKDLEEGLSSAILSAAKMLEDLHVAHCKQSVEDILNIQVGNVTLANIINNLYKMILPLINVALNKIKEFSVVFNWAATIVQRLLAFA